MKDIANIILEAIDRGISNALKFNLDDYDSDSKDLYIKKKEVNLDKADANERAKHDFFKYINKLVIEHKELNKKEKEDFLRAISLGIKFKAGNDKHMLQTLLFMCFKMFGHEFDLNWIDVSNMTDMSCLFEDSEFNGDISKWDVSNVKNMACMFRGASKFNQPIGNWDTSNVITMSQMFRGAISFNQPLANWDVSRVEDMSNMFQAAIHFNQPIEDWNVQSVNDFYHMFFEASSFDQDLSNWDIRYKSHFGMLYHSKVKTEHQPKFEK